MDELGPLLKTREVADMLGVSVSTVKRWVDAGEIRGARTVGRHRLVPAAEAERFVRERLGGRGKEAPATLPIAQGVDNSLVEALVAALLDGRREPARGLILGAHRAGASATSLGDDLIRPALLEIGARWRQSELAIHEERRGTRVIESCLQELIAGAVGRAPAGAPLAMGAAPSGDPYSMSGLLIELALVEAGWEVVNLGPDLPLTSLAQAARSARARLVWVTANVVADPVRFLLEYSDLSEYSRSVGTAIIAGGRGLTTELRSSMGGSVFGDRIAHIEAFARLLHPQTARQGG